MFQNRMRKAVMAILMGLSLSATPVIAQDDDDDDGMGMMQGRGMMGGGMMSGGQGGMGMMQGRGMMSGGQGMMGMMHGGGMHGGCIMKRLGGLDLSARQRDQIADIMRDAIREKLDLMQASRERKMEVRQAHADDADPEAIGEAYGELFDVKQKMIVHKLKTRKSVMGVLTDEQRENMEGMPRSGMMKGGMGKGRMMKGQ